MTRINHHVLRERYTVRGELVMDTALHLGTGWQTSFTDKPVLRDAAGRPLIPGASMKGAFRACVERLVPNVGLRTCCLDKNDPHCLTANADKAAAWQVVQRFIGGTVQREGSGDAEVRAALTRLEKPDWIGRSRRLTADEVIGLLEANLCDTCLLFGSPLTASKVVFDDLAVIEPWYGLWEVRDGVGIDRDSERAMPQIKYDFEAVPSQTRFQFALRVDNPTEQDKGLLALGLSELRHGMLRLGGIRSRGLGKCHLAVGEEATGGPSGIWRLNALDGEALLEYVLDHSHQPGQRVAATAEEFDTWLENELGGLLAGSPRSALYQQVQSLLAAWQSDDTLREKLRALLQQG